MTINYKSASWALALVALSASAQAAGAANVQTALELAKSNGCYSCHANAEKLVGPAFKDIAAKYSAEKDAAADLAQSIQYGSKGKWGRVPMPANGNVPAADIKTLATWVLTVKE